MRVLLQWLMEHTWIFYAGCVIGIIIYVTRALIAHKERGLALFTLERETAAARTVRAWMMVLVFVAIGAAVFVSTTYLLPNLPFYSAGTPILTPTRRAGLEPATPSVTPTSTESVATTSTPMPPTVPVPTPPPPEETEAPTPEPTEMPESPTSGAVHVRFGDFAELVSYSVSAAQVTTSEPVVLTLHWRALEGTSPMSYLVFTHLLSGSGGVRLIAQHDGAPASGTRPMTDWISGETIVDRHPMEFRADSLDYVGPASIAVGLYDRANGRVLTETGDDSVVLPVAISVVSQ